MKTFHSLARSFGSVLLVPLVLGLSACGSTASTESAAPKFLGTWTCGDSKYTFTATGWSAEGTPSQNMPYKIAGDYIQMVTLAHESLPMLKTKDGVVYDNDDGLPGATPWDSPCKKAS